MQMKTMSQLWTFLHYYSWEDRNPLAQHAEIQMDCKLFFLLSRTQMVFDIALDLNLLVELVKKSELLQGTFYAKSTVQIW